MAIQTFEELEVYAGFKYKGLLSTSLLAYALTLPASHISVGSLSGITYSGNDLPSTAYNTSTFFINRRDTNSISVLLTPDDRSLSPQLNKYTGTWSGWQSIGGDNKFIKGQAIPFYDTDGETLINSILPENLVYYDGTSGDEIASNFIYASPSSAKTMSSASTYYSPTFDTTINSKGTGFELSNGSIKCNKRGVIRVTAKAYTSAGSSSSVWGDITINGTADSKSGGYNGGLTYNIAFMQGMYNVQNGDLINLRLASWLAGYTIRPETTIICEYLEDYYITNEMPDIDVVYPVGSIYMSVNSTSPATLFGGTWQQIEDRFLLSAGSTYTAGDTGGEAEHTLTTDEMPSHTHNITGGGSELSLVTGSTGLYRLSFATNGGGKQMYNSNTGGGLAHNNMPPYLVVYMWVRTV